MNLPLPPRLLLFFSLHCRLQPSQQPAIIIGSSGATQKTTCNENFQLFIFIIFISTIISVIEYIVKEHHTSSCLFLVIDRMISASSVTFDPA